MPNTRRTTNSEPGHPARIGFLAVAIVVFVFAWWRLPARPAWLFAAAHEIQNDDPESLAVETRRNPHAVKRFVTSGVNKQVHAASVEALPNGDLIAVWYGGSREGHSDVSIQMGRFDSGSATWSKETSLVSLSATQRAQKRFTKKLGNPVIFLDGNEKLWVFYVSVSVGGWSGASANFVVSDDLGETFSPPQKVIGAPFFNMCVQLKTRPFLYGDGSIGLPVHHEMGLNFCSILRLNDEGRVLAKVRMTDGKKTMQPLVLTMDANHAAAAMRYHSSDPPKVVQLSTTDDGGKSWSAPIPTNIPNADSAIGGITLSNGSLLIAANDSESTRNRLSLLTSNDGGVHWTHLCFVEYDPIFDLESMDTDDFTAWLENHLADPIREPVENPSQTIELAVENTNFGDGHHPAFGYPYMIKDKENFHVVYSWNRTHIAHFQFNEAWLEAQMDRIDN